jgi:hypothetical protein
MRILVGSEHTPAASVCAPKGLTGKLLILVGFRTLAICVGLCVA